MSAKAACGTVSPYRPPPMKKLLLAAALAAFVVPPAAQAGNVSMRVRDVPLGARTLEAAAAAATFNMLGLHWIGSGTVALSDAHAARSLARVAGRRLGQPLGRLARRQPRLARGVGGRPVPHRRAGSAAAFVRGDVTRHDRAGARDRGSQRARDRLAVGVGSQRGDRPCDPDDRPDTQARRRPSHGGHQFVHTCAGCGDRARDRAVPRARERLERHRLQLSRRPLRHDLRGTRGRHRPERDRRARTGVQLRHRGRCARRELRRGRPDAGAA